MDCSVVGLHPVKNDLSPTVEAHLADVVLRLRQSWIVGPARLWFEVCPRAVDENAGTDFEKRVLSTLGEGFLHFSQLLAGFEFFLLHRHKLSVVSDETFLGFEELLVQLSNDHRQLVEVAQANSGSSYFSSSAYRAVGDSDE